jgi:hypothetical protein
MALASEQVSTKTQRKRRISFVLLSLGLMAGSDTFAHGGGLNAQGCHNNRKTGDYHCHRTQLASAPIASQFIADEPSTERRSQQSAPQPQVQQRQTNESARPTCYTGPRGGTYTITASGRKNYGGC